MNLLVPTSLRAKTPALRALRLKFNIAAKNEPLF